MKVSKVIKLLIWVIVFIVLVFFFVLNVQSVRFFYIFGQAYVPLIFLLVGVFALGAIIGYIRGRMDGKRKLIFKTQLN